MADIQALAVDIPPPPNTREASDIADAHGLRRDWSFIVDRAAHSFRQRLRTFHRQCPARAEDRSAARGRTSPAWTLYFVYAPDGTISDAHRFTLARLDAMNRKLLIVCAAPTAQEVPAELADQADALIWKGLSGYDFSAYAAGLRHLAHQSRHADVLVLNDLIYGPFTDLAPLIARARWDLTGFTASTYQQNHIQSYAFLLRDVTPWRLRALWLVMAPGLAFDDIVSVINFQELRLAEVASRHMSVGSLWYASDVENTDPTLFTAEALLDQGFPFIKKSALGKKRRLTGDAIATRLEARLAAFGHPAP